MFDFVSILIIKITNNTFEDQPYLNSEFFYILKIVLGFVPFGHIFQSFVQWGFALMGFFFVVCVFCFHMNLFSYCGEAIWLMHLSFYICIIITYILQIFVQIWCTGLGEYTDKNVQRCVCAFGNYKYFCQQKLT